MFAELIFVEPSRKDVFDIEELVVDSKLLVLLRKVTVVPSKEDVSAKLTFVLPIKVDVFATLIFVEPGSKDVFDKEEFVVYTKHLFCLIKFMCLNN